LPFGSVTNFVLDKELDYFNTFLLFWQSDLVMGQGRVKVLLLGSGQPSLVCVWVWKFSPKNPNFFNFCPTGQKNLMGWVKKYPGQSWVSLLFTGDQKYARVGLGRVGANLYSDWGLLSNFTILLSDKCLGLDFKKPKFQGYLLKLMV